MSASEPRDWTLARRKAAGLQWRVLDGTDAGTALQVDNFASSRGQRPSDFGQTTMALAAFGGEQDPNPLNLPGDSPELGGGAYPDLTGVSDDPSLRPADVYTGGTPAVGVARARPSAAPTPTAGARTVGEKLASGELTHIPDSGFEGYGDLARKLTSGNAFLGEVGIDTSGLPAPARFVTDVVASPVNIIAAPFGGAGILGNVARNTFSGLVGAAASEGVNKALPEDTNPLLRTALTLGAGLGAGAGAYAGAPRTWKAAAEAASRVNAIADESAIRAAVPELTQVGRVAGSDLINPEYARGGKAFPIPRWEDELSIQNNTDLLRRAGYSDDVLEGMLAKQKQQAAGDLIRSRRETAVAAGADVPAANLYAFNPQLGDDVPTVLRQIYGDLDTAASPAVAGTGGGATGEGLSARENYLVNKGKLTPEENLELQQLFAERMQAHADTNNARNAINARRQAAQMGEAPAPTGQQGRMEAFKQDQNPTLAEIQGDARLLREEQRAMEQASQVGAHVEGLHPIGDQDVSFTGTIEEATWRAAPDAPNQQTYQVLVRTDDGKRFWTDYHRVHPVQEAIAPTGFRPAGENDIEWMRSFIKKSPDEPLVPPAGGGAPQEPAPFVRSSVSPEQAFRGIEERLTDARKAPAEQARWRQALRTVADIGNVPRSMMSSIDLSGSLRQGGFLAPRHRTQWKTAMGAQLRSLRSEDAARAIQQEIDSAPMAVYRKGTSLYQTDWSGSDLSRREEQFMSALAGKLPGVKQTGRAYAVMLNKLRADVYDQFVAGLNEAERTPKRLEEYARYVNAATGRGNLPKFLDDSAPIMNAAFFSPRFLASIPQRHLAAFTRDPIIRKEVIKDLGSFYGTGMTMLGALVAAKEAGLLPEDTTIETTNYNSPDWGKVKVGPTRIDIWGGHQQFARLVARSLDWSADKARGRETDTNLLDLAYKYLRYKASPAVNIEEELRTGKDVVGQPAPAVPEQALRAIAPLFVQELIDAYSIGGPESAALSAPGFLGIGTQTYEDTGQSSGAPRRPVRPSRPAPPRPTRPR